MLSIAKYLRFPLLWLVAILCLPGISTAEVIDTNVVIDSTAYTVVASRRTARTVQEYTLKAVANNLSATPYTNVTATLISVPSNVVIVDGIVSFGDLAANASATSSDEFTIRINVSVPTSLADLIWRVEGIPPAPPPGPGSGGSGGGGSGSFDRTGIFMLIDDGAIKGESSSRSHSEWIDLSSFSESGSREVPSGAGGGTSNANFDDVAVTKFVDSSSVPLRLALAEGRIFNEIQIEIVKQCGGNPYLQYAITLTAPMISSITAGAGAGSLPTEALSISFVRIETMYTPVSTSCKLEPPLFSFYDKRGI